jgi:hypothetical protein
VTEVRDGGDRRVADLHGLHREIIGSSFKPNATDE